MPYTPPPQAADSVPLVVPVGTLTARDVAAALAELDAEKAPLTHAHDAAVSVFQPNATGDAIIPVDVTDSWVVGSDRMGQDTADPAKNVRAFFNKAKAAFRAGRATGTQWDDVNVGSNSHAEGLNTTASGDNSHAEGWGSTASGLGAHAEGSGRATNTYAHAEGEVTAADGYAAHAEGQGTVASGNSSHAEGVSTTASGSVSHAEGQSTTASGMESHAEGFFTTASALRSHAEGSESVASGNVAHAEGIQTRARGVASHAEGQGADASRLGQYAKSSSMFSNFGDAQISNMVVQTSTTDAIAKVLLAGDPASGNPATLTGQATSVLTIPASRTFRVRIDVVARRTDVAGEHAGWSFEGVIARDATGNAYFVGTLDGKAWGTTGAAAWDMTPSINTVDATNNYLALTATGEAAKTIRWVASLNWVEVG